MCSHENGYITINSVEIQLDSMQYKCIVSFTPIAVPNPILTNVSFISSNKPRYTHPPDITLTFNVLRAPPTSIECNVSSTPVDVAVLSREVTAGEYQPPSTKLPVTNVTVTMKTRQVGDYQCTVSVFRVNKDPLDNVTTSPITISGRRNHVTVT